MLLKEKGDLISELAEREKENKLLKNGYSENIKYNGLQVYPYNR